MIPYVSYMVQKKIRDLFVIKMHPKQKRCTRPKKKIRINPSNPCPIRYRLNRRRRNQLPNQVPINRIRF